MDYKFKSIILHAKKDVMTPNTYLTEFFSAWFQTTCHGSDRVP